MEETKKDNLNVSAVNVASQATGQAESNKNPAAVVLGRLGGLKGGKARAKKLSKAKRSAIAKKAARKRWGYDD